MRKHDDELMGVRKVTNSKSDLYGHSTSLTMVPVDRPYAILLDFHYSCIFILHRFRDYYLLLKI